LYGDLESGEYDNLFDPVILQDLMHQYIDAKNAKIAELEEENAWLLTGIKNHKNMSKELSRYKVFIKWKENTIHKLINEIDSLKRKLDTGTYDLDREKLDLYDKLAAKERKLEDEKGTVQQLTQKIIDLEKGFESEYLLLERKNESLQGKLAKKEKEYNEMVRKLQELYVGKNDFI